MFFHTRILSSTATVLVLMAGFIFLLMAMLSPECKCPHGFTESQCNFTNIVCLTQTMFVKGDIRNHVSPLPTVQHGGLDRQGRSLSSQHVNMAEAGIADVSKKKLDVQDNEHSKTFVVSNFKSDRITISKLQDEPKVNGLHSHLFLYNLFPVILLVLAAILALPSLLWKYEALENDIGCLVNTLTFAGSDVTNEKSQMKCVEQMVRDLKFFLRCFEHILHATVRRMYILRVIIPCVELLTLTFALNSNPLTVFNPLTSISKIYSLGQSKFPKSALCHFRIVNRSATSGYTTPCSLPASPLLQLLTPLVMSWLLFLALHGLYSYFMYRNKMSFANQSNFYRKNGLQFEYSDSSSPQRLFGHGGFVLFTTISKSDSANIMPRVLSNLSAVMKDAPVTDDNDS